MKLTQEIIPDIPLETQKILDLKESRVPTNRIERMYQFGSIGVGIGFGLFSSSFKRVIGASDEIFTPQRMQFIVDRLTKMRGAALKLGQMLNNKFFPPQVQEILTRVQAQANYMPKSQLYSVLESELGDWRKLFEEFEETPFAAASIGQVHKAVLASGEKVAIKVQYPGIADSIVSDLNNLKLVLNLGSLLPKGLYLDNTLRVAALELEQECDYTREAASMQEFSRLLQTSGMSSFQVPKVFKQYSTKKVLVTEFMDGFHINNAAKYSQRLRDAIGTNLFTLCMAELFKFKLMQTDPNWSNFLLNPKSQKIVLLDFGATRAFPKVFIDNYLQLLEAGSRGDKKDALYFSEKLGFLTGHESLAMKEAHLKSFFTLAQPLAHRGTYDFSAASQLADTVKSEIPTMLRERLTPPPDESYSLHRKLSGCFLLCTKLGAKVDCNSIFQTIYAQYNKNN